MSRRARFRVTKGRIESDEEGVVQQIIQGLGLFRIPVWRIRERIPGEGAPSTAGIPDLMGYLPKHGLAVTTEGEVKPVFGTALFIEVKRPGKHHRSPEQIAFIEKAKAEGCVALFAQDFDDVVREMRSVGVAI